MIKIKKERIFSTLLKLDIEKRQELKEKEIGFLFEKENAEVLNKYIALSLLTCSNYIPAEACIDCLKSIITKNFILTSTNIQFLIKQIIEIGQFSLKSQDLYLECFIEYLFSNTYFEFYIPEYYLPSISSEKANQKVNQLIEKITNHIETKSLKVDFSVYQKKKENQGNQDEEEVSIFPFILNEIFQRQIITDMFPDENKALQKFTKTIARKEGVNDYIQLPYNSNQSRIPPSNQLNQITEFSMINNALIKVPRVDNNDEIAQIINNISEDLSNSALPKLNSDSLPNENDQQKAQRLQKQREEIELRKQQELELQLKLKQEEEQKQQLLLQQQQQKLQQEQLEQQKKLLEQQKQQQVQQKQQQLLEQKQMQEKANIFNPQAEDYFGKEWKPELLNDCLAYYLKFQGGEKMENQLKIEKKELTSILQTSFDNIYDVCFKAAYFDKIINSQDTQELKNYCEYHIIQSYLNVRNRKEKQFFSGCQNIAYITILLLYYFNNESFFKLLVGTILYNIPSLIEDQAYEFDCTKLKINEFELFFVFQMLLLFDNPEYFVSHFQFKENFVLRFLKIYWNESYKYDYKLDTEINVYKNVQPRQSNQFQSKIRDNYFKLILCSESKDLSYYLLTIQKISNHSSILDIERFIDQQTKIEQQPQTKPGQRLVFEPDYVQDLTWSERINQVRRLREEIHSSPNEEVMPRMLNISLVNLQAKLAQKFDAEIYDSFIQKPVFKYLIVLKLYQTGKCLNFTLKFLPSDNFASIIRQDLYSVAESLQKVKTVGKQEQEQLIQSALSQLRQHFGSKLDKLIDLKLKANNSNSDCENIAILYFPILFYEYFDQKIKSKK